MNKVAIYPGTFDPITYGHIDVIKKALKLFDKIVVGVSDVGSKNYLFNSEERINIVNKALFKDLNLSIQTATFGTEISDEVLISSSVAKCNKVKHFICNFHHFNDPIFADNKNII